MERGTWHETGDGPGAVFGVPQETARPGIGDRRVPAVVPSWGQLETVSGDVDVRPSARPKEADMTATAMGLTRWDLLLWWLYIVATFAVGRVAWSVIVTCMERRRKP